ncbi:methyltransferase domain-containing protein [Haloferula sp. A504]|uniref:methyltransferase domain-containing protein n=1 Tax=Haloferula sp. A504 TaxID=3373601 RepID=UPI0031C4C6C6|nr:class I SAM-dependent methyltransferase [Verrucomicrobiaceae bacterium E54]
MNCRHCQTPVRLPFLDLGSAPPSNAYLTPAKLSEPELWFPLRVGVCENCWLVQTEDFTRADALFDPDYGYFSAMSESWLRHCERFVGEASDRFGLNGDSRVVEVASNDGYLLQYVQERGIPCLGIEPTHSTAELARNRGIEVVEEFFGRRVGANLARQGWAADLMIANNVLAHVPDINDFVSGFAELLKPSGVASFEFPHLLELVEGCQFDTIYHEHFSYLSLTAVKAIFEANGLRIIDVERLPTHGGSLRIFADRLDGIDRLVSAEVRDLLELEKSAGMTQRAFYEGFQPKAESVKMGFIEFLVDARRKGKRVAGYGAAAKGNTLLNFAGVRGDLIEFVADRSPGKQGKFLPGSRIPIVEESVLLESAPDYVIIFPWNLKDELMSQLEVLRRGGTKLVTAVPGLEIHG